MIKNNRQLKIICEKLEKLKVMLRELEQSYSGSELDFYSQSVKEHIKMLEYDIADYVESGESQEVAS
ncbi:MAG: hypothetical protein ACE5PV_15630 [Candidatus Poribacteria bacterium]